MYKMKHLSLLCLLLVLETEAATSFGVYGPSGVFRRYSGSSYSSTRCKHAEENKSDLDKPQKSFVDSVVRLTKEAKLGADKTINDLHIAQHVKSIGKSVLGRKREHEFADLVAWIDSQAKLQTKNFFLQENRNETPISNQFSLSLALHRFVQTMLIFAIRIVLKVGKERAVLTRLPTSVLVQILQLGIDQHARPVLIRVVATELDNRLKKAVSNDYPNLANKLAQFTGKRVYSFGDITRTILERAGRETKKYKEQVELELSQLEHDLKVTF
jgi:hypothetical protein